MFHHVERPFSGGGFDRLRGEAVDVDLWRSGRRLVDQRYLSAGPIGHEPKTCPCGRRWVAEVVEHPCEAPDVPAPDTHKRKVA